MRAGPTPASVPFATLHDLFGCRTALRPAASPFTSNAGSTAESAHPRGHNWPLWRVMEGAALRVRTRQ